MTAQVIDFKTYKTGPRAIEAKEAGQVLIDAIEELETMLTRFKFDVIAQPYSISDELHCHLEHMEVLADRIGHNTCNFHNKAYDAYLHDETNPNTKD